MYATSKSRLKREREAFRRSIKHSQYFHIVHSFSDFRQLRCCALSGTSSKQVVTKRWDQRRYGSHHAPGAAILLLSPRCKAQCCAPCRASFMNDDGKLNGKRDNARSQPASSFNAFCRSLLAAPSRRKFILPRHCAFGDGAAISGNENRQVSDYGRREFQPAGACRRFAEVNA